MALNRDLDGRAGYYTTNNNYSFAVGKKTCPQSPQRKQFDRTLNPKNIHSTLLCTFSDGTKGRIAAGVNFMFIRDKEVDSGQA